MSDSVYKEVLYRGPDHHPQVLQADEPGGRSFIPVEFAVAAYRFGHSITRPRYTVRDVFDSAGTLLGSVSGVPLFQDTATDNNLNGHRELLPRLKIQWSKFFNVAGRSPPPGQCASSTLRWPTHCSRCPRRRCPTPTLSVCCRSGISAGAGRWACLRDSRWLG